METSLKFNGTELVCPRGAGDGELLLNMKDIVTAEHRLIEVAFVTPAKAAELLAFWADAKRKAYELVVQASYEMKRAERVAERIRDRLLIDEVPGILEAKGINSSTDTRKAVLGTNQEYQDALDRLDYLTAVTEWMRGKLKSFESAYFDVKDNRDASTPPAKDLSGGTDAPVGRSAFGTPRY